MLCREQVAQLRDRIDDIRQAGAELVIVGNGAASFASAFREEFGLDCRVLVDPDLVAYRAAGMRRGRVEALSPRLPLNAFRAWRSGARQEGVQGDPWQLGGVFVIRSGGELAYRYISREAGDHPPPSEIIDALRDDAARHAETRPSPAWPKILSRGLSAILDPTIALSFDRTGFRVHALGFDPADLDVDLSGRRCLVTGANSGIGFETASALADLGAEVVLLCRDVERGQQAADAIRQTTGSSLVSMEQLDVSSLESVRDVAARLASRPVDVLVHNAGVLPDERVETSEGLELTWATHVLGPFLLTDLLRGALEKSPDARVIWVSSGGMYTQRLRLDDPNWQARAYDGVTAYAETKRAQVVLAELWAEALRGTSISVSAMHPGWADTPSVRLSLPRFWRLTQNILRTPAEGADTVVWLAAARGAPERSGKFFLDRQARSAHYLPWTRESEAQRQRLWRLCQIYLDKTRRSEK